tara:strand:- start:4831 stop:7371 length:2541 start_codon:yes stop_codon:yes gene_type:complete
MVRNDWGTIDALRGVLGKYYTTYYSSKGDKLYNYGSPTAMKSKAWNGRRYNTRKGGRMRTQISKPVLNYTYIDTGTKETLVLGREWDNWNRYKEKSSAANGFLVGSGWTNRFYDFISGEYSFSGIDTTFDGVLTHLMDIPLSDHTAQFWLPSADAKMRAESGMNLYIEPVYNYYDASVPVYETTIAPPKIKEYHLPNVYYLQSELINTSSTLLAAYHLPALTLDQTIDWFVVSNAQTATETNVGEYYQLYSQQLSQMTLNTPEYNAIDTALNETNRNFAVLYSDLGVLQEQEIQTLTMPFYTKLVMGYDADSRTGLNKDVNLLRKLARSADTKDFIDILQYYTIMKISEGVADNLPCERTFWKKKFNDNRGKNTLQTGLQEYPVIYDLEQVIEDMLDSNSPSSAANLAASLNDFTSTQAPPATETPFRLLRDYRRSEEDMIVNPSHVLNAKKDLLEDPGGGADIAQVIKTFNQILEGVRCHTETLMYIVRKRPVVNGLLQEAIQTYYISEQFPQLMPTTLFDSQVKYNQKYVYDIDRVMLVFGNEYEYDNVKRTGTWGKNTATVSISNYASVKAMIVPYVVGGMATTIMDKPPVPPEVSFYAARGVDNQIRILLNSSTGELSSKPVAILDEDRTYIEEEYLAQTGMPLTYGEIMTSPDAEKLTFKSDDPVDWYEIFRLDVAPEKYTDFLGGRMTTINPTYGIPGEHIDKIKPNQKYYYCARSIDMHGNKSNPTHIYEIEMINNNGKIFFTQEIFDFPSTPQTFHKSGRRFLYVEPAMRQVIYDPEIANPGAPALNVAPPTNTLLGAPDIDRVWGKKFRLRVTSKKTGRKIDLNITFKNSGLVKPSE